MVGEHHLVALHMDVQHHVTAGVSNNNVNTNMYQTQRMLSAARGDHTHRAHGTYASSHGNLKLCSQDGAKLLSTTLVCRVCESNTSFTSGSLMATQGE